jgi:hypothetical protein
MVNYCNNGLIDVIIECVYQLLNNIYAQGW